MRGSARLGLKKQLWATGGGSLTHLRQTKGQISSIARARVLDPGAAAWRKTEARPERTAKCAQTAIPELRGKFRWCRVLEL